MPAVAVLSPPEVAPPRSQAAGHRRGALALVDQAAVSGTSFASVLLLGRAADPAELGLFALGFTVLILLGQVQHSLVCSPYTIFAAGADPATRKRLSGSALSQWALLSALASLSLLAASGLMFWLQPGERLASILLVLAVTTPWVLLRELARRMEFARLYPAAALAVDVAYCLLHLGALALLWQWNRLTSVTAHLSFGGSCALVAVVWVISTRARFAYQASALITDAVRYWRFGRWLLGANMVLVANMYLMQWMLWFAHGPMATGIWAACATLVDLSNPFMLGVGNIFGPHAAHTYADRGAGELRRLVQRYLLLLGAVMAAYASALAIVGPLLLPRLFGSEYGTQSTVLAMLAAAAFVQALGMPLNDALSTIHRPQFNLLAGSIGLALTVTLTVILLPRYGLSGAAAALLGGQIANVLVRHVAFWPACRAEVAT